MKQWMGWLGALCLVAGAGVAHATEVHPFVGFGVTGGGDRLATVNYNNGDTATVHAGGLIAFNGGLELRFTPLVSMQAQIGYHVDRANASNGSVTFSRVPIEVLGHFRLTDDLRVGGGGRYTEAHLRSSGVAAWGVPNVDFKPNLASVVELEYFPLRSMGIKLRYVSEKLKPKGFTGDLDASHGGLFINYYFF